MEENKRKRAAWCSSCSLHDFSTGKINACFMHYLLDLLLVVPVTTATPGIACQWLNGADETLAHDTIVPEGQRSAMKTHQCLSPCSCYRSL